MQWLRSAAIFLTFGFSGIVFGGAGGLDVAGPIGGFLNGSLPPSTPRSSTGDWRIVDAFPSLAFNEPVQMIPMPRSNQLLIAEKEGRLVVFEDQPTTYEKRIVLDIRGQVESSNDSGLLGVAFHPEFGLGGSPNRNFLYVYYRFTPDQRELDKAYLRLSRFTWDEGSGLVPPGSERVLINQYDRHNWHSGGGLVFGNDGFLYLTIGDEGGVNDFYDATQRIDGGFFAGALRIDVDQNADRSHPIRRQPRHAEEPPAGWPPSYSQDYFIPNDNPWIAADGSVLEEFFAVGLRSPHRLTLDPFNGDLWVGDVGQSSEEEVSKLVVGGNYQWPFQEGVSEGPKTRPHNLLGVEVPPIHSYGRSLGTCVIGGYVYRGSRHPELQGKYLFGDLGSAQIWTAETAGGPTEVRHLLDLSNEPYLPVLSMSSFGIDAAGELYLLFLGGRGYEDGRVYRIDKRTGSVPEPPTLLSQTGAFSNLANLAPAPGVIPYEVNQPLWSDGAEKKRWIAIPNDGSPDSAEEQIVWSEEGSWSFPIGTVLIKHFEFPGRRLETRFMVRGEDGAWFGFTYRWREDGTDAVLQGSAAVEENLAVGGTNRTWHFPGRNECASCHNHASGRVLGVSTRQLNRDFFYETTGRTANQLVTLNELGFFAGGISESSLPGMLTSRNQDDTSASLERRARSYLDVNCAHCHQPGTSVRAVFDARLSTSPWSQNLISVIPHNDFGIPGAKLVTPGNPDASTIFHRAGSVESGVAMPPVAKHVVDGEGMELLREWIASLDPAIGPTGFSDAAPAHDPTAPRITLSKGPVVNPLDGTFTVALSSSEPLLGLTLEDFAASNVILSGLEGSGNLWTLRLKPRGLGPGSLLLPADRVTDPNGNANEQSLLSFEIEPGPELLEDGGFESGLTYWGQGPRVSASNQARSGNGAVALGTDTFVVQTLRIQELQNYLYTGYLKASSMSQTVEVGLTFRDANGVWIDDEILEIMPATSWQRFERAYTAPVAAREVSVWVLSRSGGPLLVDELSIRSGGPGQARQFHTETLTNRLLNGNFESGLTSWQSGGEVSATDAAPEGTVAARLGSGGFIVQSHAATPGEAISLQGLLRQTQAGGRLEAGFSFWDASGGLITDRTLILTEAPGDQTFLVDTIIPQGSATLTAWIWRSEGDEVIIDDLRMFNPAEVPASSPNLLGNGDFEGVTLAPWETGAGEVSRVAQASTGNHLARIASGSAIIQSLAVTPGATYRFSGRARSLGSTEANGEVGLSFWSEDGEWLGDEEAGLAEGTDFATFLLTATVPNGAVLASVWIWCDGDGGLEVDDLRLTQGSEAPGNPPQTSEQNLSRGTRLTLLRLKSGRTLDFAPGTGLTLSPSLATALGTSAEVHSRGWSIGTDRILALADSGSARSFVTSSEGPATIAFQWQLEDASAGDGLSILVDGKSQANLNVSSLPQMMALPVAGPGLHTIEVRLVGSAGSTALASFSRLQILSSTITGLSDLYIGAASGKLSGEGVIEPRGLGQVLQISTLNRKGSNGRLTWKNSATGADDAADFLLSGTGRGTRLELWETGNLRRNISAMIKSGRYQTPVTAEGDRVNYQLRITRTIRRGQVRMLSTLQARSVLDSTAVDGVRIQVRSR